MHAAKYYRNQDTRTVFAVRLYLSRREERREDLKCDSDEIKQAGDGRQLFKVGCNRAHDPSEDPWGIFNLRKKRRIIGTIS